MRYKNINELSSLKGQPVTVKGKTGAIVKIEKNKIHIQFEHEKGLTVYTITDLKNKTVTLNDSDIELATLLFLRKKELNSSDSPLFNSDLIDSSQEKVSDEQQKIILDQWRMVVESAIQVSTRRQSANNLFITILTILVGGVLFSDGFWSSDKTFQLIVSIIVSILGVFICCEWMSQIKYYGELNDIKYSAVRDMEKHLPVQYFNAEDVYFYDNYISRKSFSKRERNIPICFLGVFVLLTIIAGVRLCSLQNNSSNVKKNIERTTNTLDLTCTEAFMTWTETEKEDIPGISSNTMLGTG